MPDIKNWVVSRSAGRRDLASALMKTPTARPATQPRIDGAAVLYKHLRIAKSVNNFFRCQSWSLDN